MEKIFVTIPDGNVRNTFMPEYVRKSAEEMFDVTYNETGRQLTGEELKGILADYDGVITGWGSAMLDKSVLENNDRLKLIAHTGGTVGNLVDEYAYEKGITVMSGNMLYAESVAEGTIAYMLMAQRRIPDFIERVRGRQWRDEGVLWEGLLDKSVGIVGLGTISRIVIKMLQIFRCKIKVYSGYDIEDSFIEENHCEVATLDEIFSECDIISVHSALNDKTRGLVTKSHFEQIKDGALFINTARGAVIDEEALIEELKKNRFRAVLDVYVTEPLTENSLLRTLPNVYALPHMAGPTSDRRDYITKELLKEMQGFFDGAKNSYLEISAEFAKRMTKM